MCHRGGSCPQWTRTPAQQALRRLTALTARQASRAATQAQHAMRTADNTAAAAESAWQALARSKDVLQYKYDALRVAFEVVQKVRCD